MAFNAGAIEATLTLNRNPFTAGLAAARNQARSFARERFEATITLKVVQREFERAKQQLRDFARNSRQATAQVNVDRVAFDKLVRDLREFGRQRYVARAVVNTEGSTRQLDRMLKYLKDVGEGGERSFRALQRNARDTEGAFQGMDRTVRMVLATMPLLLTVGGSAVTGLTGLVGGLAASLSIAGLGVAAFAAVAIPAFTKVKDAVGEGQAAIDKLPNGLRQAANALKGLQDQWSKLATANEGGVGFALAAGFNAASNALSKMQPLIGASIKTITELGNRTAEYFNTPHWSNFVKFAADTFGPTMTKLYDIIVYLARGVMNLIVAFQPLGDWILAKVAAGMKEFADWAGRLASNPAFHQWVELAKRSLEALLPFIGNVIEFFFRLSAAVAPVGNKILDVLTMIFEGLNKLPPEWLSAIAVGISAIFTAMILGASGPVGLAVGAVVGLAAAFTTLYDSNEKVRGAIDGFANSLRQQFLPIWNNIVDAFNTKIKPAWDALVATVQEKFMPVFERLYGVFQEKVVPALASIADTLFQRVIPAILQFLKDAAPFVAWFTEVLGNAVMQAFEMIVRVIDGALKIIEGLFQVFSSLFTGNWDQFWQGLKNIGEGILTAIAGIFGMKLDEFLQLFKDFGAWVSQLWNDLWQWVSDTLSRWWEELKTSVSTSLQQLIDEFTMWKDGLTQLWNDFWTWVALRWEEFVAYLSRGWTDFWNQIGQFFTDWWNTKVQEWNTFWTSVGDAFNTAVAWITTKWDEFWTWLGNKASEIWDAIVNKTREAKDWLIGIVNDAATGIGNAWRAVANFFRDPINWVINVVLNDGVLGAWNTVMGWIGAESLSVGRIPEIPAFASGGPVHGGPDSTPNKDSVRAWLMPGEYVFSKRAIANLGGLGAVDQMHQAARNGFTSPLSGRREGQTAQAMMRAVPMDGLGFAYGGVQPHVAAAGDEINRLFGPFPGGIGGVGQRANASDHPVGLALDFMTMGNVGLGNRVADFINANWGRLAIKYQIWQQRIANSPGAWVGMENRGSPTANHMDHVHASFLGEGGAGGPAPTVVSWWSLLAGQVTNLLNGLLNFTGMPGLGSPIGNAVTQIPIKIIPKVIDALREKLSNLFTTIFGAGGDTGTGPTADRATAQAAVRAVAERYGWGSGAEWAAILSIVMKESSWNPNAANPNSSARGLFQKMTSIHGPLEPTIEGQAEWGLNYIRSRYGTPSAALRFHNANGYYDRGGLLQPGDTYARNETGRPERVLDPRQTDAFERLVQILDALVGQNGALINGGNPAIGNLTVVASPNASAKELIEEAMFQVRRARRGGRY